MNATKKKSITAILIAACVVIALLAGATGAFAKNMPDTDTEASNEAETSIESNPVTVIYTAETIDAPAEPTPEPADVPAEPVTNTEIAAPEPVIEQELPPVIDSTPEPAPAPEPTACSYCASPEHTASHCTKKAIEQRGATGRFRIPSLGVDVAMFSANLSDWHSGYAQSLNDAADSGVYYEGNSCTYFTDHASESFRAIKACTIGTKIYFDRGYTIETYEVSHIVPSYVNENHDAPSGLYMYTCNNSTGTDIFVAYLTRVS